MTVAASRRWWMLAGICIAVAAAHWLALLALGSGWIDPEAPGVATPVQRFELRQVQAPRPGAAPPTTPSTTPAPAPAPAGAARTGPRATVAGPTDLRHDTQSQAQSEPIVMPGKVASAPGLAEPGIDSTGHVLAGAAEVAEVPVYATRLPPAGQWRYRLQRGLVSGEAELAWAPHGDEHYELHLTGRVAGVTMLEWASQGRLDAAGVAPERLAIRRRGRDRQAVNFQRAAGKITFSGPTHEVALLPGAQDRLSWIVQLSAVVAAAPERFGVGASIVLFVAGARGDADLWTFVVQGVEPLDERPTLKLVREPRRRYDTRAEIWLDPAEYFIPLRLVQTPTGGGAALELQRGREAR